MKEKACYEALISLLLETNITLQQDEHSQSHKDTLFLQRLVLQGRWDDVERFLKPLLENNNNDTLAYQIHFVLKKQKLLETLSWQGGGGERWAFPPWKPSSAQGYDDRVELEDIMEQINAIKPYCTVQVSPNHSLYRTRCSVLIPSYL